MEKISRVVRGNARVASTDLKNAAPVRPGAPSFGRPIGESTAANPSATSTAAKAVALHKEMEEAKKARAEGAVVQQMADQFFMNRVRKPAEDEVHAAPDAGTSEPAAPLEGEDGEVAVGEQPKGFKPRGSFVDVRA